jgi:hypothetical protein
MMYRLEIENFYSIKERQVIDLTVGRKVPEEPGRLEPIHEGAIERAPRVVAIFGANASGKSNLLRAISFIAWFVRFSFEHRAGQFLPYLKFASDRMIAEPTRLSVTFRGSENLLSPDVTRTCPYVYALELAPRQGAGDRVLSESLHYRPKGSGRFVRLIERTGEGEVKGAPGLGLGRTRQVLHNILRPDASVFPTLAQLNNPAALSVVAAAATINSNILLTRYESDLSSLIATYSTTPSLLEALNRDIRRIDVGVERVEILRQNGGSVAMFRHLGLDQPIGMELESHGTQQFVRHFPILHFTLANGGIAVIDELDSAIHPAVLPEILRWFSDPQRNPHGAQLWISCHSTSLLDDLLKEEVLICEKSSEGSTTVYRLGDVKGIRRGDDFARRYLGGIYGGVPRIG